MKTGWHFENLLQRGLLMWAMGLPNGSPEFRYVHHEIIEESQHTLMFQEFVNRSGLPVRGMPRWARVLAEVFVVRAARDAPATFFVIVLGGEDPADHIQREELRRGTPHPLVEQIIRIHVTEEARHISFARNYLRQAVPRLGWFRRRRLALQRPADHGADDPHDPRAAPRPAPATAICPPRWRGGHAIARGLDACWPTPPARCGGCATSSA